VTDALAKLNLPGSSITLQRATREDLPAIVGLLINDPLGSSREAASEGGDFGPYATESAAIDIDQAQLLVVATDGMDVVANAAVVHPRPGATWALRAQVEASSASADHR